jgi:hypothetical protein
MTQFENYRWEDHTPRPGRWKFDLLMTLLSIGLLLTAIPQKTTFDFPTFSAGVDQPPQDAPEPVNDLRQEVALERVDVEQRPSCSTVPPFMRTAMTDKEAAAQSRSLSY